MRHQMIELSTPSLLFMYSVILCVSAVGFYRRQGLGRQRVATRRKDNVTGGRGKRSSRGSNRHLERLSRLDLYASLPCWPASFAVKLSSSRSSRAWHFRRLLGNRPSADRLARCRLRLGTAPFDQIAGTTQSHWSPPGPLPAWQPRAGGSARTAGRRATRPPRSAPGRSSSTRSGEAKGTGSWTRPSGGRGGPSRRGKVGRLRSRFLLFTRKAIKQWAGLPVRESVED